jgi:PQQ-dependent dehydrogenase (methanol/ethanol family)
MSRHPSLLAGALAAALGMLPLAASAAQTGSVADPGLWPGHSGQADADGRDWPSYNHDPGSQRYSPLAQIDIRNVHDLKLICSYDTGAQGSFQSGLVEAGGALFGTLRNETFSIDPDTCKENWRRDEGPDDSSLKVNRGVAWMDGRIFRGLSDGRVAAYDASSGRRLWTTAVADLSAGEDLDAAPVAWNGLVFIGNAGGDDKGVKGHIFALDARSGRIVWEAFMVPRTRGDLVRGPLAPDPNAKAAAFTWINAKGFPITGGATWTSYTLDPDRGLLYIPGGNPAPDFYQAQREGDNLYTSSVVVLDARTGAYRRHFQLVPNDFHDWDVSSAPMLATSRQGRSLLFDTPKDGHLYAIDLASGRLHYKQAMTTVRNADVPFSMAPTHFCPGITGGSEWNGPAFDPRHDLVFSGQVDWCSTVQLKDPQELVSVALGQAWAGSANGGGFGVKDDVSSWSGHLTATDAESGEAAWTLRTPAPIVSGVTATAGGLLFAADLAGNLYALDAQRGKVLWTRKLDGALGGGLITYDTGRGQRVAVADGLTSSSWATPTGVNAKVVVYGL